MKESGTTGAGEPQITGVPRVHVHGLLKLVHLTHGRLGTSFPLVKPVELR